MTGTELDLLSRLASGRCKIRRYPSGQWSRGGNKFKRTRDVERMLSAGWIEHVATTNRGIELYDISERGRNAMEREIAFAQAALSREIHHAPQP